MNANSSMQQGDVIFTTSATADPIGETIEYTVASGVGNSVVLETPNLFDLLTGNFSSRNPLDQFLESGLIHGIGLGVLIGNFFMGLPTIVNNGYPCIRFSSSQ